MLSRLCFQKGRAGDHHSHSQCGGRARWIREAARSDPLPFFSLGPNPSEPLSSSTPWAGRQCRSCPPPCGHPLLEDGPYSPESSGAELFP